MSLISKIEVFFGGQRLSSAPECGMFGTILLDHNVSADDRSTGWASAGLSMGENRKWHVISRKCRRATVYQQIYLSGSGAIVNIPARFKSVKQLFCVFTRLGNNTTVHTTVPSNATTYAMNNAEVAPINSSGMNGGTSTFINGNGYLNNVGQQVNGITGWRLRVAGLNYGIVTEPRAEARFELMKCFHKLNASDMSSSVTQMQFMEESYVIGMSLESYGADKFFYDGLEFSNAGSVQLEVDGNFANCVANVFLVYDKVLTITDGLISYKE
ncbi:hypothetical protein T492DRAFT_1132054 [Pavlovales sp. CCMP2436]|nr:hypothetical protein T492DRAFT_1132054 [Pavlovales sp. CCMP2436]